MINVVRHPVSQFLSAYYFSRYGWGLEKGKRQSFHGTHEDRMRSVDECYAGKLSKIQNFIRKYDFMKTMISWNIWKFHINYFF